MTVLRALRAAWRASPPGDYRNVQQYAGMLLAALLARWARICAVRLPRLAGEVLGLLSVGKIHWLQIALRLVYDCDPLSRPAATRKDSTPSPPL